MAIDSYMVFQDYTDAYVASESTVDLSSNSEELATPFKTAGAGHIFEVQDYSFNVEQTLNMSSQSTGVGAGKIVLNPFSITRAIDKSSPGMFKSACAGTAFKKVVLGLRKSAGTDQSGLFFLRFDFKLVAVKTISWAHGDESPTETIEFQYGGLQIRYTPQNAGGSFGAVIPAGWNSITNVADVTDAAIGAA